MKTLLSATLLVVASLALYAFRTLESDATEVLRKLNIPEPIARESIWSSFSGGYLSVPNVADLKKIARGDRAAIVREIGSYAKAYTATPEFKQKYTQYRESQKPEPPKPPQSVEDSKKEQRASMQKAIREAEENMKNLPSEARASMKEAITMMKEQLKSIDDPKNPMYSKETQDALKQGYEMEKKEYEQRLATWEKEYPTTPSRMISKWLREFLDVSKDVDFGAKLVDGGGGKMAFALGEYENKSSQWKMCYRAGKETVEAGRSVAAQWLKELEPAH